MSRHHRTAVKLERNIAPYDLSDDILTTQHLSYMLIQLNILSNAIFVKLKYIHIHLLMFYNLPKHFESCSLLNMKLHDI